MKLMGIDNSLVRLFCINRDKIEYFNFLQVWRVMLGQKRVIIRGRMPYEKETLELINGCDSLHLSYGICRDPSEYIHEHVFMRINNLKLIREWLMNDRELVNINAEFSFSDYWMADSLDD